MRHVAQRGGMWHMQRCRFRFWFEWWHIHLLGICGSRIVDFKTKNELIAAMPQCHQVAQIFVWYPKEFTALSPKLKTVFR
jgi:hypothetical protein